MCLAPRLDQTQRTVQWRLNERVNIQPKFTESRIKGSPLMDAVFINLSHHNKVPWLGWYEQQEYIFSRFWRQDVQDEIKISQQVRFLQRPFLWVCRWPSSLGLLVGSFLCTQAFVVSLHMSRLPLFMRTPVTLEQGAPCPVRFNIIVYFQGPISKFIESHSEVPEVRVSRNKLGGNTVQPVTYRDCGHTNIQTLVLLKRALVRCSLATSQ